MKINGNEIRQGYILEYQGKLWRAVKAQQVQMGNWRSYWQVELKDIRAGTKLNERFGSSDVVERVRLDEKDYQFLFKEGDLYTFMDTENYEQIHFNQEVLGDATRYLVSNSKIKVEFYEGKALGVELPTTIDLRVVETEPGMPSATVSNVLKPAKLETGLVVQVPHFVQEGEVIRVDTTEGKYVERVRS